MLKIFDISFLFSRITAWWMNKPSKKLTINQG